MTGGKAKAQKVHSIVQVYLMLHLFSLYILEKMAKG